MRYPSTHLLPFASLIILLSLLMTASTALAQTSTFTYQGRLTDSGTPANATYDMQFKLYDAATGGNLLGSPNTVTNPSVTVTNGVFTVQLNFGDGTTAFPGADRFIEVNIRPMGSSGSYSVLAPRQKITSTAYAIRSLNATSADTATTATTATNATQLGGQPASQYVLTSDSRLSDARTPAAGSSNYVQNGTNPQTGASFNIDGNGTAGGTLSGIAVNSQTNYQIGGNRVLGVTGNTVANSTTFVGSMTGASGDSNSFFGVTAGNHTTGYSNSFFGTEAGLNNTKGNNNAFFGAGSGALNKEGVANSFFGYLAGFSNTTLNSPGVSGNSNSFFGYSAGYNNTTGSQNAFVGDFAGLSNTTEGNNTFIGGSSNGAAGVHDSTAIGFGATVTASNTIALGRASETVQVPGSLTVTGSLTATATNSTNLGGLAASQYVQTNNFRLSTLTGGGSLVYSDTFAGLGAGESTTPNASTTDGNLNSFFGLLAGNANTTGCCNSFFGAQAGLSNTLGFSNSFFGINAGNRNMGGSRNSLFGDSAGFSNTSKNDQSFFGYHAGINNAADGNSFFGSGAGTNNTAGTDNSFFGLNAGQQNLTANGNSFFGSGAGMNSTVGGNSFFGFSAGKNSTGCCNSYFGSSTGSNNSLGSNNSVFGNSAGFNSAGSNNSFFGLFSGFSTQGDNNSFFGYFAGRNNLTGANTTSIGYQAGLSPTTGTQNTYLGANADSADGITGATAIGYRAYVTQSSSLVLGSISGFNGATDSTKVGIGATAPDSSLQVNGQVHAGTVRIDTYVGGGSTQVCVNTATNQLANCSSSLRYKKDLTAFVGGLQIIKRLRPISFTWKGDGMRDIGLGAEEVARVEPLLTFRNSSGQIEGVKYNQLSAIFINAFKEQQAQIEQQQSQISHQQQQLETLRRLVCLDHPQAEMCR